MSLIKKFLFVVLSCPLIAQAQQTEIMLVAVDHFEQVYKKEKPLTDVLATASQKGIAETVQMLAKFKPDLILVERLPERQMEMDSLYNLNLKGNLDLKATDGGRDEIYQLAFALGKRLSLKRVHGVNAPGGSSQGMLDNGTNIEIYKDSTTALRSLVTAKYQALAEGSLTFKDFIVFLNSPAAYNKIYQLRYMIPARVTNGTFKNPDEQVNTAFLNNKYIGAELTSIFKRRDYMIYSNVVNKVLQEKSKRIMLLIGTAHIGSLRSIFRDDPEFKIIETTAYLQ